MYANLALGLIGASCIGVLFWGLLERSTFKIAIGAIGLLACVAILALP